MDHIGLAKHRSSGVALSWPTTMQDDWCDQHPDFDHENPKLHDEPFWPSLPTDKPEPLPTLEYSPIRAPRKKKMATQGSLFD